MFAVFKREFKSYFTNMTSYVVLTVMFFFCGFFTTWYNLINQRATLGYVLSDMEIVIMVLIPILCMKSLAEDRSIRTDQLLFSLPINTSSVVFGKYFALVAVYGIGCVGMGIVPLILRAFGPESVSLPAEYASLLAFFLLGVALIAICMFFSGLTESQLLAAVFGIASLLALYLMNFIQAIIPESSLFSFCGFTILAGLLVLIVFLLTKNYVVVLATTGVLITALVLIGCFFWQKLEGVFKTLVGYLAVFNRYSLMTNGIFDITAIVYFLSIVVFFVFLTIQSLEKRRWN